jgi:hypothetical protein
MLDPSWLACVLTGIVLATALYCAGRIVVSLARGRRVELDADLTHILMGIGMAGMFVTRLAIFGATAWSVVFALVTAWYAVRFVREGVAPGGIRSRRGAWLHAGHLVASSAMLYMFLAIPASPPVSGPAMSGASMGGTSGMGAHLPTLALLFAGLLLGYVVLVADRIPLAATVVAAAGTASGADGNAAPGASPRGHYGLAIGRGALLAPRGAAVCELTMSLAMCAMLVAML